MSDTAPAPNPWPRRLLRALATAVLVLVLGLGALLAGLETQAGRDQLVKLLPRLTLESGLGVRIARITGSLWRNPVIEGLALTDPSGVFAEADRVRLDWRPLRFITGDGLEIRSLVSDEVRLARLPTLKPTQSDRLLPDFDIAISTVAIDRLEIGAAVAGGPQLMRLRGSADIADARAKLGLALDTLDAERGGGDRLRLTLDAEPERDRLELSATLDAPEGGVILGLLGLETPLTLRLGGQGSWARWAGKLSGTAADEQLADVSISADNGRFAARGMVAPALLLDSAAAAGALGPALQLVARVDLTGETKQARLRLSGPALELVARGGLGADEAVEGLLSVRLLRPGAVFEKLSGDDIVLRARLAGRVGAPLMDWLLTADALAWGETGLTGVRAAGLLRSEPGEAEGARGLLVPLRLRVAQVSGVNEVAAPLLRDLRGEGTLRILGGELTGQQLRLRGRRLEGTVDARWRFADGDWRLGADLQGQGIVLAGLGVAQGRATLSVVPAGEGARTAGNVRLRMTAMESEAVLGALDGLPTLDARFVLAPDLALRLDGLRLAAPAVTVAGRAALGAGGALDAALSGDLRDYGPLSVTVSGDSAAPGIQLALAEPGLGIGLNAVSAAIRRSEAGWSVVASGASSLGPLNVRGEVLTPAEGPTTLVLETADALGLRASGTARTSPAGPLLGDFAVTGDGLVGRLTLADAGGVQGLTLSASADAATLPTATPILIEQGTLRAQLRLAEGGLEGEGSFDFKGLERDEVMLDEGNGSLRYAGGEGRVRLHASGESGAPFSVDSDVLLAKGLIEVTGKGRLGTQAITLSEPARFVHEGDDWALAPVKLMAGEGSASFSGRYGEVFQLRAELAGLPLRLLSVVEPSWDFGGELSGLANLRVDKGGTPRGSLDLSMAGLTRNGAAASSLPINVGLTAELGFGGTVARLLIKRGGKVEGRAQVEIGALLGEESFIERLYAASVAGKLAFDGPAQALWGLGGNDAVLVGGPVKLAAQLSGTVGEPVLDGRMTMRGGRLEAGLLGTVVEEASLDSRFVGSTLELTRFSGRAGRHGRISGGGQVSLSAERGFPMDIRLELDKARMLDRDDFDGTGSGTLRIATDEYGGVVSGKISVDRAAFRIGRATAAEVPVLNVTERNVRVLGRPRFTYVPETRWLLDLDVNADRRMFVSGLGIDSEWQADLQIKGGAYTPELFGRVQLVRGDYDFAGRRFQLTRGDVRFQGGYPPDPLIDLSAESSNSGFTALLAINGTANRPAIAFSSVPALPQDEVLSRLLFGDSVTNLSAPEAVQLAGALATLQGGGGFNPINAVRSGLGIDRLRILPADQQMGRGTAVAAGQYIGRDVYVELATDAQGYTATNIEVSITRSLSLLSQVATLGGTGGGVRWQRDY